MGFTREQNSYGGSISQGTHAANAKGGNPTLFGGNPHEFTFEDRSLGGTNATKKKHEVKNADGKSVKVVKQHEVKNADDKSVHALKMLAKRKYSGQADESNANYKCPNCPKLYVYDSPREKSGLTRKHQRCGGKSQVLVPYSAVH
jgi:hypothetical protein